MDEIRHRELTKLGADQSGGFESWYVDIMVEANLREDDDEVTSAIHFDNCTFAEGAKKIKNDWNRIWQQNNRLSIDAAASLGRILHTVQDFYAHSNWIELHLASSPIPLWDFSMSTLPAGIVSGTWAAGQPKKCGAGAPSHEQLAKDKPTQPESKKIVKSGPNKGKTYFELVYEAALRATKSEMKRLMYGVRRYRITTRTGDVQSAGTDADVFVNMRDAQGNSTGRIYLNNPMLDDFERGQTDIFCIALKPLPGPLASIDIGYDPNEFLGEHPGWFLSRAKIEDMASGAVFLFECNRWLSQNTGDGKTIVTLDAAVATS